MFIFHRSALIPLFFIAFYGRSVAQCNITVDAGEDIYLCAPPSPTQLNGSIFGDYLDFWWTPGLGPTLNPTVTVSQSTFFVLTATAPDFSNNVVMNGDFESGNTGFSSDYGYSPGDLVPEGLYDVLDNPMNDHPGFADCDDHTSGAGQMMVVNGSGSPNQNVWCQTVNITPNTQYVLSAWATSVVAASPALLQFSINGTPVGPIFSPGGTLCNWQQYFQTWDSGNNSSATICIVNQNTVLGGNDFALDDIVFAPVCTVTDTVHVEVINITAFAAPSVVTLPCDGAEVTLSGIGSSAGPEISYQWTTINGNIIDGETTLTPTVNAAGEYTLTVSYIAPDGTVCEKTAIVNVILNPNPLSAWINPPNPLGCGSGTTQLIGNSSQSGFSTYSWSTFDGNIISGASQKIATVDQVGTYSLTVTNTNTGCTATAEVEVTAVTTPPTAVASVSDTLTCFQDTVLLSSAGSSSGANITYSWTTIGGHFIAGQNLDTALVDSVGIYVLHVTNTSTNCTSYDTVTVIGNLTPPHLFVPAQQQITCTSDTLTMIVYLYPPPFVLINWTASNGGHIVSGEFTPNPQVDSAGDYHVSVQDPINGCFSYGDAVVFSNMDTPMVNIVMPGVITCQSPSITLSGDSSSTGPNFGYLWTAGNGGNIVSGDTTLNPVVNAPGTYTLTVIDSINGCVNMATDTVAADTNVVTVVANSPDTLSCSVQSINLNANGSSNGSNISYLWTTSNGNIVSGEDTANPLIDQPGTYQLEITNTVNGCTGTDLAIAIQNISPPQVSIDPPDQLTCAITSIDLSAHNNGPAGSYSYNWTASNGGNIIAGQNTLNPTVDAPGTYIITSTNNVNGCTSVDSTLVEIEAGVPVAATNVAGPLTCTQLQMTLDGTGSSVGAEYNHQWSAINGGNILGPDTNINAIGDTPGDYILVVTNTTNGCVVADTISISQDIATPLADAGLPDTITCTTPIQDLLANGPNPSNTLLYSWISPNGNFISNTDTAAVMVDLPGLYIVQVTNPGNGCTSIDSVQILQNTAQPQLLLSTPDTLTCSIISQNLQVQNQSLPGSFTYVWTASNGGNIVSGDNTLIPNIDAPGTYTLTATDLNNGCSMTLDAIVLQDINTPSLQIASPAQITCSNPQETLQGQNLSLPGNFSYSWAASNGGNIVSGINGLNPVVDAGGDYTFTSFNLDNGCSSNILVSVIQNTTPPTVDAGLNDTLTCNLNSLALNGSGSGAPNLNFEWTASNGGNIVSGGMSPTPVIDAPGTYTLTVTDPANGCSSTDALDILNDANAPSANAGLAATLTCSLTQTMLNATASTGTDFSYNWTAGNGGNIVSGNGTLMPLIDNPGVYTLVVTNNANGCTLSSSVTVLEDVSPPQIDAGANATLTCASTDLNLLGTNSSGPATYSWQTTDGNIVSGGNSLTPNIDQTGTYMLTATLNANGCTASDFVTVGIDTILPGFTIQPVQPLTCAHTESTLQSAVQQPGTGNYTITWETPDGHFSSGQNTLNPSVDQPGTYILTIESTINGCDASLAVYVSQDINPPNAVAAPAGNITCAVQSLALSGTGSTVANGVTYNWSTTNGQILNGGTSLSPNVGSPGTYTLVVTTGSNGCTSSASTTVGIDTISPVVALASPGTLTCVQNTVTLNAIGSSSGANFTPLWTTSNGNIASGQGTLMVMVDQPGGYQLNIQNSQNGCSTSAQVLVNQDIATPNAEAGTADPLNCNELQVMLNGSSTTTATLSYAWISTDGQIVSGAASQTSTVDAPGTYTLTVTNETNGCTAVDDVLVYEVEPPEFVPTLIQPDCHTNTGMVDFGGVSNGQAPFQYSTDGGQTYSTASLASNLTPGIYSLVVNDEFGCTAEEAVVIDLPFIPSLSIATVSIIDVGDSIQLKPFTDIAPANIASWQWTPSTGLSCTDCENPWATPSSSTVYMLVVTDQNGCDAEAQVQVLVNRKRNVYAPNIFSPNQDGVNDIFTIFGKNVREIQTLQIFDRWGNEVFLKEHFQASNESTGWDGNFRGSAMNPAVFVWWAKVEFTDGEVELYHGDVTLVR
ncbi:MAG: gliding motility-associated C-terminal domain-containing protein [Saprospiraceae bacterium]|nr:gliding motility-associated C-terminal domain-containing protein [Saprospiraceae bacterium]